MKTDNIFPFSEPWFKELSITDQCKWLIDDAKKRPPLEFVVAEALPPSPVVEYVMPPQFDAAQDAPTPIILNPAARAIIIETFKQNLEWEIALPTFRAYRIGDNTRHSALSLISLAHTKAFGIEPEEADIVMIDEVDNKYQFHYSNLHSALKWAFGSDNPVLPDTFGLPMTSLRDLLCMTKKSNKRPKIKFPELIQILEQL